ncbi:alpha/beta fold hydrolase [Roseinatronobacter alkalisoli]|uniref:Alpha/beta hydrolase n=1 Tax=Roseinatronobacter alkalisoli TaxID=3028235 RepID=A0ABT5TA54_9RHOB|nr:alpha/beta hydrolase family protein [Roseinatronobacter sp. HJB301]MDD7970818.1 alpha/beta hydrolase [Roseinatronobacter sp. HJB301]
MTSVTDLSNTRRRILQGALALGALAVGPRASASGPTPALTFVLVHGAWHGGWCWGPMASILRSHGHQVYTPTLTGLGERAHLSADTTDLDTHITDIVSTIRYEDLNDVVLVGHSYAGMVITGVADQMADKLRALVYLDAFLPDSGQSFVNLIGDMDLAALAVDQHVPPMLTVAELGITDAALAAFVGDRLTDHPIGTLQQELQFDPDRVAQLRRIFIQTSDLFGDEAGKAASAGFEMRNMGGGHNAMLTQPQQLAELLLDVATE